MIELTRKAEEGDRVHFAIMHDLMPREGYGKVLVTSPYGARIEADQSPFWAASTLLDIPRCDMVVVLDDEEVVKYLLEQMKLIRDQDQAAGGALTAAEQANSMKAIAIATLNKFKDIKK